MHEKRNAIRAPEYGCNPLFRLLALYPMIPRPHHVILRLGDEMRIQNNHNVGRTCFGPPFFCVEHPTRRKGRRAGEWVAPVDPGLVSRARGRGRTRTRPQHT
jgi:hypothetical protein